MINKLLVIQQALDNDLVIGAANRQVDLIRTGGWSETMVDSTRLQGEYQRHKGYFELGFFKLIPTPKFSLLPFVENGVRGLFSRAGNCQEFVGLAIYRLFTTCPNITKISVVSLPEAFDHIFLELEDSKHQHYIFDPWAKHLATDRRFEGLLVICDRVLDGLKADLSTVTDREEISELELLISQCEKQINQTKISLTTEHVFNLSDRQNYIAGFETYYKEMLLETYPTVRP